MEWLAYLGIGALVGFAAGLLGIGGGAVMVPLLVFVFTASGVAAEHVLHVALGTALAAMIFTSLSSMRSIGTTVVASVFASLSTITFEVSDVLPSPSPLAFSRSSMIVKA